MSIAAIIVLAIIVVGAIIGAYVAEDPIDTLVEVEAATSGMAVSPLSTRVGSQGYHRVNRESRVRAGVHSRFAL